MWRVQREYTCASRLLMHYMQAHPNQDVMILIFFWVIRVAVMWRQKMTFVKKNTSATEEFLFCRSSGIGAKSLGGTKEMNGQEGIIKVNRRSN